MFLISFRLSNIIRIDIVDEIRPLFRIARYGEERWTVYSDWTLRVDIVDEVELKQYHMK